MEDSPASPCEAAEIELLILGPANLRKGERNGSPQPFVGDSVSAPFDDRMGDVVLKRLILIVE